MNSALFLFNLGEKRDSTVDVSNFNLKNLHASRVHSHHALHAYI